MLHLLWFNFSKCVDFDEETHSSLDVTSAKIRDVNSFENLDRCNCCDWRRDSIATFDEKSKGLTLTGLKEDVDVDEFYEILVKTIRGLYPKSFYFGNRNMMVITESPDISHDFILENFCKNLANVISFTCNFGEETTSEGIFFDSDGKINECKNWISENL